MWGRRREGQQDEASSKPEIIEGVMCYHLVGQSNALWAVFHEPVPILTIFLYIAPDLLPRFRQALSLSPKLVTLPLLPRGSAASGDGDSSEFEGGLDSL